MGIFYLSKSSVDTVVNEALTKKGLNLLHVLCKLIQNSLNHGQANSQREKIEACKLTERHSKPLLQESKTKKTLSTVADHVKGMICPWKVDAAPLHQINVLL